MVGRGASTTVIGNYAVTSTVGVSPAGEPTTLTTVGWEHMSRYNPLLSAGATVEGPLAPTEGTGGVFWQRDIQSNGAAVTITMSLDRPALGGETVSFLGDGDAIQGIHWTTVSDKTVTLVKGQSLVYVVIAPVESGKWYRERTTKLRLSATGLKISDDRSYVHLVFNSVILPPVVTLTGPTEQVKWDGSGSATPITMTVATVGAVTVQDPVTLYWEVVSGPVGFDSATKMGTVVIAAGASSGTFNIYQTTQVSGGAVIGLVHERGTALMTQMDYDTTLSTFTVPRTVHADENLWRRSNNLIGPEMISDPDEFLDRPLTPGHPSSVAGGGATSSRAGFGEMKSIPQVASPALQDPITEDDLWVFHPHPQVTGGMSYMRESFDVSYGGGASTAHDILPYSMTRWYFKEMVGADASRNAEFARVQVRHRNSDRNHGVVFRFSYKIDSTWDGTTVGQEEQDGWKKHSDGSSVVSGGDDHSFAFPSSPTGLIVWEYSKWNGHANSNDGWGTYYGAGEDSNGTYLWFKHFTDKNQSYATLANETLPSQPAHGGTGALSDSGWWYIAPGKSYPNPAAATVPIYREYSTIDTLETWDGAQGVASGNPIEYPIWVSAQDGSANVKTDLDYNEEEPPEVINNYFTNRLGFIKNNDIGCLIHSMQFSMSVGIGGVPGRFWPGQKSRWDPQGGAIRHATNTAHEHTITITGR